MAERHRVAAAYSRPRTIGILVAHFVEGTAEGRSYTEEIQEPRYHQSCAVLPRFADAGEDVAAASEGPHIREDTVLRPPLTERL